MRHSLSSITASFLLLLSFLFAIPQPAAAAQSLVGFTVAPVTQSYGLRLGWQTPPLGEVEIQRSLDGLHAWATIVETGDNTYTDENVACSKAYFYRARVVESATVTGPWTPVISATVTPCAPGGLLIYSVPGWYNLDLHWSDLAPDETRIYLERSRQGTTWSPLANLPPNTVYYAQRFDVAYCSYTWYYRLRSERNGIFSPYTPAVSGTLSPCAPGGTYVQLTGNDDMVRVRWADKAPDESGFEVWRSNDSQPQHVHVASLPAAEGINTWQEWIDPAPVCQQHNAYIVRSVRGPDSSPWSTSADIFVPNCAPPTATPTATPTPTATATATPTATPSATPTATATPSPTVTATPSATATATLTPSPSPTATPSPTPTATPQSLFLPLLRQET